jgi:hypothetical protein
MPQLKESSRSHALQRLSIGIRANEVHAINLLVHHMLDSVAPATAYSDDFNNRMLR